MTAENTRECKDCGLSFTADVHSNRLYCDPCNPKFYRNLHKRLSEAQKDFIRENKNSLSIVEVSKALGLPRQTVSSCRAALGIGKKYHRWTNEEKKIFLQAYLKTDKITVNKVFPGRNLEWVLRSCSFRKCVAWTEAEQIEMVRMAGFLSFPDQVAYLRRPTKTKNSMLVWNYWTARRKVASQTVHGLTGPVCKILLRRDAPFFELPYQIPERRRNRKSSTTIARKKMVIWSDARHALLPSVAPVIREAVEAGAAFQRWLYQTDDPASAIRQIILERTGLAAKRPNAVRYRKVA